MITSAAGRADAEPVGEQVKAACPPVELHTVIVDDIYSIPNAKAEVEKIRKLCLHKHKEVCDIMCDFTGLTKSMSAGMIFACAAKEARLQ